jgi:hypothetical protein
MRLITEVDANEGRADGQNNIESLDWCAYMSNWRLKLDLRSWTIRQPAVRHVQRSETDDLVGLVRMTVCMISRLYYGWAVAPLCYDIKLELRRLSNL